MSKLAYRLVVPVIFPEGVHPGAGSENNKVIVSRDGKNRPVLRGSAIAGVLRSAYSEIEGVNEDIVDGWFGKALDGNDDIGINSRLITEDAVFENLDALPETVHNMHNRHTGAVFDQALFSEERIPAGARAELLLTLKAEEDADESEAFLRNILALFSGGLFFGGAIARGMGRVELDGEAKWKSYDLTTPDGAAAWLDDGYAMRKNEEAVFKNWAAFVHEGTLPLERQLHLTVTLRPARGQDFLIAAGGDMSPLQRLSAAGRAQWVLPGSTLRGLFRDWIARLAAREGKPVFTATSPDEQGWAGKKANKEWQRNPDLVECPVMRLFGSFYARSRIHISDALAKVKDEKKQSQKRMHVSIDRFAGGANESALFDNYVLTDGAFPVTITVNDPTADETRWLAQTLKALDLGLIRVGSSKASGRLEITALAAEGPFAKTFNPLKK
jgi:CRISPR/Cas system CSM-associated protein Csm3 (group 7 of RAMP superfamily)